MNVDLVWKALLLGVLNAAPIGPVGLMCLRKNVEGQRLPGILAAMGMAFAYAIVSFCVLFGLNGIGQWLNDYRVICQLVAGICLLVMGWQGLRKAAAPLPRTLCPKKLAGDFTQSFAMTLLNPVPFATFAFILTSFHIVRGKLDLAADLIFSVLVFSGTMLFWVSANQILHGVKKRRGERTFRLVNRGSSVALMIFGALILVKGALEQSRL
ncbi:MAG: LysE family transporter [Verrucomicrobiales bacterium]|jgi:threonine/homoserine/homoserine lactone efflux protein|nr:LysE family transporter [bacterium]MDF2375998.1 LysE family transporter [Verrucomicrobiales bacterium]